VTLARSKRPDLVIIDLQIAGMSGIETTRQITQMDVMKGVPVVALTAGGHPGDLEELARIGCRGYITKPIDTNMLTSQVELYLEG
jgi:CheY-like chemotaxis protein